MTSLAAVHVERLNGSNRIEKGHVLANADERLVARCQRGEKKAFELLIQKYQRRIYHLIYRMTQDSDMVEPLAQEVFLKAYRSISKFKGKSQFYTWIYRIAVNTCLSHIKRDSPEECYEDPQEIRPGNIHPDAQPLQPENPETQLMRKEFFRHITASVRKLPEELQTTIVLREYMGMNYEEISEVLGIPLGTVRSRIFRARAQLREYLAPFFSAAGPHVQPAAEQ